VAIGKQDLYLKNSFTLLKEWNLMRTGVKISRLDSASRTNLRLNVKVICSICKNEVKPVFDEFVLYKYKVFYFYCDQCGFLQTEKPYWLKEAYKNSINICDTGQLVRNLYLAKFSLVLISFLGDTKSKFLDYASGYGVFVRLMRDLGLDFYWYDPYTENIFAKGFEYNKKDKYNVVTCFECFEHLSNPLSEIKKMLEISNTLIFSTETIGDYPPSKEWAYYGFNHGQHISFYSKKSFHKIASIFDLNYYSFGWLHLFSKHKLNQFQLFLLSNKFFVTGLFFLLKQNLKSKTINDFDLLNKRSFL